MRADIHDGPELSSNSDTLMEDHSPPTRQIFLVRTAGPDISACPCDVRFTPKSGHRNSAAKCPLWVKSRHRGTSNQCPLYPQKQTLELGRVMSALCQKRTSDLGHLCPTPPMPAQWCRRRKTSRCVAPRAQSFLSCECDDLTR